MKNFSEIIKESNEKIYVNCILKFENSILILRRANYLRKFKGMWCFPGGSLDKNDKTHKDGALRELKEETGITLTWNEEHDVKLYDTIKHKDDSTSEYYIITLKSKPEVKISREHSKYEWFNIDNKDNNYKWVPEVFQLIQKIID